MSAPSVQNLEEAANIVSEYISSLDNLPSEVQFLLQEMRTKDQRAQEIEQEVTKEANRYIRHTLKADADTSKERPSPPPPPMQRVRDAQQTLAALSDEKIALAQRILELLNRKRGRLEHDLRRVLLLQGDTEAAAVVAAGVPLSLSSAGAGYALGGRNPAQQITESLRNAYGANSISAAGRTAASQSRAPPAEEGSNKRRKLTAQTSIRLSPAPSSAYTTGRGRNRKKPEPEHFDTEFEDEAQDGDEIEGEEIEGDDADDGRLYCFCQTTSYGEMIGCDNAECPYEWFHLPCVNLSKPIAGSWFCPDCTKKGFVASGSGRKLKGRK